MDDIIVPIRQTNRQRMLEEAKKRFTSQQSLTINVNTILMKEQKRCNYCSKINPFFRIDCGVCGGGLEKK